MAQHNMVTLSSFDILNGTNNTENEHYYRAFFLGVRSIHNVDLVVNLILTPLLASFGIVANIVNIVVFVKIGFLEPVNIMFLALSIADLVLVIIYVIGAIALNAVFEHINTMFFNLKDLVYVINPFTWGALGFGSCTTALIAVERSICVILPLKVKTIFTPRRTILALFFLFLLPLATVIQKYISLKLEWATSPVTNQTRLVFIQTEDILLLDSIAALAYTTIPSLISFVVVMLGTTLMVIKLNQSARWRQVSTRSVEKKTVSAKEVKVVRSVLLVCIIFIVCFTPNVVMSLASSIYLSFHIANPFFGPFVYIMFTITHFFQVVSSSINICIYLRTSSKYKETFKQTFHCTR